MSEKTPKHISQLTNTFEDLISGTIMYGYDSSEHTDKQLPLDLIINKFDKLEGRIYVLEQGLHGTDIVISNFAITPSIGIQTIEHNHVITATFDRDITHDDLILFNLTYGINTIDLINNSGVTFNGNSVTIILTSLQAIALNENVAFAFSIKLSDGSTGTTTPVLYTNVPNVEILTFSMAETHNGGVSNIASNFTISNYNTSSVITAFITDNAESNAISAQITVESDTNIVDFIPVNQLLSSKNFTLTTTQTVGNDIYTDTESYTLIIIEDTYLVTFTTNDDIPESLSSVTIRIYNDNLFTDLRDTITSDISGEGYINLPNGTYYCEYSKLNYTTSTSTITVDGVDINETIELVPNVSITSFTSGVPVAGSTMTTQYTLSPLQKYEDSASIVYTITPAIGSVVVTTKIKATPEDTTYKTLDIDAGWGDGTTIHMLLTSTYNSIDDTEECTVTIGQLPVYYGIVTYDDYLDWATTTIPNMISTLSADDYFFPTIDPVTGEVSDLSKAKEYSVLGSINNPTILWQDGFTSFLEGWDWIAFPTNDYSPYLYYSPMIGTYEPIGNVFHSEVILIGSSNYTIYFTKGNPQNYPNMGTPSNHTNRKFNTVNY